MLMTTKATNIAQINAQIGLHLESDTAMGELSNTAVFTAVTVK